MLDQLSVHSALLHFSQSLAHLPDIYLWLNQILASNKYYPGHINTLVDKAFQNWYMTTSQPIKKFNSTYLQWKSWKLSLVSTDTQCTVITVLKSDHNTIKPAKVSPATDPPLGLSDYIPVNISQWCQPYLDSKTQYHTPKYFLTMSTLELWHKTIFGGYLHNLV